MNEAFQRKNLPGITFDKAMIIQMISYIIIATCPLVLHSQDNNLRREIDKIIRFDAEFEAEDHPGFLIGIIDNDTTFLLSYPDSSISKTDLFEIGGLTKPFTALYAIYLSQLQNIDLSLPVNSFLPESFKNPQLAAYSVSDLLTHKIPFPKRPNNLSIKEFNLSDPYESYSKTDLLEFYASFSPPKKKWWQRNQLYYSHISYALLEVILETQLQTPFQEGFNAFLRSTIGLNHTNLNPPFEEITQGYNLANLPVAPQRYQSFAASEGLKSNMEDLLKFMTINISPQASQAFPMIYELQKLQRKSSVSNHLWFSSGWYVLKYPKSPYIYTHAGTTEGHKASMHFCPETGTGVIILSKSTKGTGELGLLILRMVNYNWTNKKNNGQE